MIEKRLSSTPYGGDELKRFSSVAKAFDGVAEIFDTNLENKTSSRLRMRIYSVIRSLIRPGSTVLDINCGTGIDVLYFSKQGYGVYGTDISENMIAVARMKLRLADQENVRFSVSSFDRLSPSVIPKSDLVFSNFGGLNCTSDLDSVARAIASVTKPGGYFVGVIMSPFSLWESVSYAVRFQWRHVLRRAHKNAPSTGFAGTNFPVYYYSPNAIVTAFSRQFIKEQVIGLSILSPTPQSTHFVQHYPSLANMLIGIDGLIERIPVIRAIGDHYIIVLQRRK